MEIYIYIYIYNYNCTIIINIVNNNLKNFFVYKDTKSWSLRVQVTLYLREKKSLFQYKLTRCGISSCIK